MEDLSSPRGLIIDLITPLNKSGDIDGRSLGKHLDRIIPHVQAVLLAGPHGGEGKNLNASQREELLEKALGVVRGQLPILVWITQDTPEKTRRTLLKLKKRLDKQKYTGHVLWVDTPLYYHSNRGLASHYRDLCTLVKKPFLLHNDPELIKKLPRSFKRNNIRTSILKDLIRIKDLQGLIFLGSLDRARNYHKAVRSRTEFRIYDGDESRFLKYPSLSGVVSIGANLLPKAWEKVTASSLNLSSNRKTYPNHLQQIWELGEYLRNLRSIYREDAVPLAKQILWEMGMIEDPACTFKTRDLEGKIKLIRALMKSRGDYP